MTADDRHRCRWHVDGGRCNNPRAFPGVRDVPELCTAHLHALEPWAARRAALRASEAGVWIDWVRRKAEDAEAALRALGERRAARR